MIKYSPQAAKALAYLKRSGNDIDIFVEDTSCHNMWLSIIRRMLPSGIHLSSVNLLGGRNEVLAACKLDQADSGRPKLYIIDGDFDFLLGRRLPSLKYLHRIDGYCIENCLINEHSVVNIGMISQPDVTEKNIRNIFKFEKWYSKLYEQLLPLFSLYATSNEITSHIQTIGFSVKNLYINTDQGPIICPKKLRARLFTLARAIVKEAGYYKFKDKYHTIKQRARKLRRKKTISGKDYIFPILFIRICKFLGYRGTMEQLKTALASFWTPAYEPTLDRRIKALLS